MTLEFDNEEFDFGKMLDEGVNSLKQGFNPGEKVTGTIVSITSNSILLDINAKSEGIVDRGQFEEDGEVTVNVGDKVEVYFVGMQNGEIVLTTKMKSQDVDTTELFNAYNAQIPIEGKVTGVNKAGLEITVGGIRGFCPASQIDTRHIDDFSGYTGQVMTCMVTEVSEHNLVLSRRRYLEQQNEEKAANLKQTISEGDMISGTVSKVMDFGVFVDIGGVDGLVPMGEISWERVKDASEYVTPGAKITVKVLKLDWDAKRFTLSIKQAGSDPWDELGEEFRSGIPYTGLVTRIADFGAFVQLKPGVEGLVHISRLGAGRRLSHPREVCAEGQEIEVFIESIDLEQHRISLTVEKPQTKGAESGDGEAILMVGSVVKGTVEDHKPYGAFIRLSKSKSGLLHISELDDEAGAGSRDALLKKMFPLNEEVTVAIKDIRDSKISLGIPGKAEEAADLQNMLKDQKKSGESFGSLGGLFDSL